MAGGILVIFACSDCSRGTFGVFAAIGKRGSLRDKGRVSTGSLQYQMRQHASSTESDLADLAPQTFSKAVLYVLGEKTQVKVRARPSSCWEIFIILIDEILFVAIPCEV